MRYVKISKIILSVTLLFSFNSHSEIVSSSASLIKDSITGITTVTGTATSAAGVSSAFTATYSAHGQLLSMSSATTTQAVTSTGVAAEAKKLYDKVPWYAKAVLVPIIVSEGMSAYESFKNGRKLKKIGDRTSACGDAGCENDDGSGGDGSNSGEGDGDEIFASQRAFNNFIKQEQLDKVFGQVKNPLDIIKQIEKDGFKLNDDGSVTAPNGTTVSAEEIAAASAPGGKLSKEMASLKQFAKKMKKKEAKYIDMVQRYQGKSSGGYANRVRAQRSKAVNTAQGYNYGSGSGSQKRKPAKAYGPLTYVKGDPIGAEGDNVFYIIERSYESMVNKKSLKQPK